MKWLQNNVLGGKKLNCLKATQVLGGPTQIFIWGSIIAKYPFVGGRVLSYVLLVSHLVFIPCFR